MFQDTLSLPINSAINVFDFLYPIFEQDFVATKTYINKSIYIDPKSWSKEEGKECSFWHLVTKNDSQANGRYLDTQRAERLHWIKPIIENHSSAEITMFYHRQTSGKKHIRLYLWAKQEKFVVILQKLGRSSSFLVTSFYLSNPSKEKDYNAWAANYESKMDSNLKDVEWF